MPQLPVYDAPQVAQRGPQFDQANADSFGAIQGRQLQQLGRGVSDVGGVVLDEVQRARERDSLATVLTTEASTKDAYRAWSSEAMKRQGASAKGLAKDADAWWQKATDDALKGAADPMVQRALTRALAAQRGASLDHISGYENHQLDVALQEGVNRSVKESIKLAVATPVQGVVDVQINAAKGALTAYGANRWTPEVLQGHIDDATYAINKGVFDVLAVRDATGAQAYYLKNRQGFNPLQYDEIEAKLKTATAAQIGGETGRALFAQFTAGKTLVDPVDLTALEAEMVKAADGKPEVLAAMRAEVDRANGIRGVQKSKYTADASSKLADMMYGPGGSLEKAKLADEWKMITGEQRASFEQHYKDRKRHEWAQGVENKLLAQRELDMRLAPAMLEMSRPEYLTAVSPDDIRNMVPTIGTANVATLLQQQQRYATNQAKLSEAKVDNDSFDAIMAAAGLNPKPKSTEKDAALIAWRARQDVELAIGAQQAAKGRELSRAEKDEVMRGIIHAKVLMPSWGGASSSEEYVAGQDPAKVAAKGMVNVPITDGAGKPAVRKLNLSSIPANEYADLVMARMNKGLPIDPASVAQEWWMRTGSKGKK